MASKNLEKSLLKLEALQEIIAEAKIDACSLIAEALESDNNLLVDQVSSRNPAGPQTFEEAVTDEDTVVNDLGQVLPRAKVILFLKKERKGKHTRDWPERFFGLWGMDLDLSYPITDPVKAKFQLIGHYLDSEGTPTTQNLIYLNCYLIERYSGMRPEFMLAQQYNEYVLAKEKAKAQVA